jgi:recombination protein RecR
MIRVPQSELDSFAKALENLKKNTVLCSVCKNVSEHDPCSICIDEKRDKSKILVVEEPLDILVFEKTGKYHGLYHVLHGAINPLDNVGPDELYIQDLLNRVHNAFEIIIATNPTMEGEATAMYLSKKINELMEKNGQSTAEVSRLGMGIPTGADLGYADSVTLSYALEGRRKI